MSQTLIRMTEYSHGAGCGCKIAPKILDQILKSQLTIAPDPNLLVGNQSKDDAAVYDLGNGTSVISTTDFFMPIVDDPFEFGQIAATNAISDIYAMGGRPLMAIAILGWPIDKLSAEVAQTVVDGGRKACQLAGIPLAGGHSIDSPEPIFGLAVTGIVDNKFIKRNDTAEAGCQLYLTKPLGIGILTTAEKQKKLKPEHARMATDTMCQLNKIGAELGQLTSIKAMTDVTGFGLLGHLIEICDGSQLSAQIDFNAVPKLAHIESYLAQGCTPGGAQRNYESFAHLVGELNETQQKILCDPQTSGGLLIAVKGDDQTEFLKVAHAQGLDLKPIGFLLEKQGDQLIQVI